MKRKFFIALLISTIFTGSAFAAPQDESAAELNPFKPENLFKEKAEKAAEEDLSEAQIQVQPTDPKSAALSVKDYIKRGEAKVKPLELKKVIIEGCHSFAESEFEPFYKDMIDKTVTFEDLDNIAQKITNFYIDHDYLLSHAYVDLSKSFSNGAAKIIIINGGFRKVHVLGADQENKAIKEYQEKIINSKPVTKKTIQRYIKLIDNMPGYSVQFVRIMQVPDHLRQNFDGYADLVLVVKKVSDKVRLAVNNNINKSYGDYNGTVAISLFSPFKKGEEINVVYTTSNRVKAYKSTGLLYTQPLNTNGTVVKSALSYTENNPSAISANNTPNQQNNTDYRLNLELAHPFILTNKYSFTGALGIDVDRDTQYSGSSKYRENNDIMVSASTSFNYNDAIGDNYLTLEYGHGLPNSSYKLYNTTNTKIQKNYNKLNANYFRLQPLVKNLFFTSLLTGQYSDKALPAVQKISFGGQSLVRGYKSDGLNASRGFGMQLELRYPINIDHAYLKRTELYSFFDYGKVHDMSGEATSNLTRSTILSSAGYGLKADIAGNLKAGAQMAYPLKNLANNTAGNNVNSVKKGQPQATFFIEHVVEW